MKRILVLSAFSAVQLSAADAFAYVGPGAGISAIGSLLALVATVALMILGFVWYPVKRLRRRLQGRNGQADGTNAEGNDSK